MNITAIHPARNENQEILPTVESMRSAGCNEVLVYDDGSDIPLDNIDGAKVFRNDVSKGPSVCRNLGGFQSSGDYLVFADAHTRIGSLAEVCEAAENNDAIVVPAMTSLYRSGKTIGYSRNFILKGKDEELIGFDMFNKRPDTRYTECTGNWGGFFVMTKKLFLDIDGWVDHQYWGYNDPSLILKAFFCDKKVILDRDTIYKHKGKVETGFGYPVKAIEPLLNIFHSYYVLFENHTFENYWLPKLQKTHKWMYDRGLEHISKKSIQEEEKRFKQKKKMSDDDFFHDFMKINRNGKPI